MLYVIEWVDVLLDCFKVIGEVDLQCNFDVLKKVCDVFVFNKLLVDCVVKEVVDKFEGGVVEGVCK